MTYPKGYEWFGTSGPLPKVVTEWLRIYGVTEFPGPANNPVIMGWNDELVAAGILKKGQYTADSIAFCGLGMAIVALRAGKPVQTDPLWAQNWQKYGNEVARNVGSLAAPRLAFAAGQRAILGDTLVFSRAVKTNGKTGYAGHVGTYVGEDATAYHVFGTNQGDIASGRAADTTGITRIAKSRCIAVRRPPFKTALPASAKPYWLAATGALSRNEA